MSEVEAAGRALGWLVDLYLVVGALLVIVLVPQAKKALREFWFAGEAAFWWSGAIAVALFVGLVWVTH